MNLRITKLDTSDSGFSAAFQSLRSGATIPDPAVTTSVREIINRVREHGDSALLRYARDLDGAAAATAAELEVPRARLDRARDALPDPVNQALAKAAQRIRAYHEQELAHAQRAFEFSDGDGNLCGQRVTAVARAGLYVPGGRAAYPSSVLMSAIPARIAGVGEVCMAVPRPGDAVLAAATMAGVDRVFAMGGAHAVAAFAYGTATVPKVDVVAGPGNVYVAAAKRMVFGDAGVDMVAGPSEVVVVCDTAADPERAALDLCAQAEHDESARAILLCDDPAVMAEVEAALTRALPRLARRDIIAKSLAGNSALIQVRDMGEALTLANQIAPEHLQLMTAKPAELLPLVTSAGAVFLGGHSAEVLGDYCAGPSHILPTAGSARFASPLGVATFQKRTSVVHCTAQGAAALAGTAAVLAECEGLDAHAAAARARCRGNVL